MNSTLSLLAVVNATTESWGVEPLPANVAYINGTLTNGTILGGCVYNGTTWNGTCFNNTVIVQRVQSDNVGSVSLISFIYMIMSLLIIIAMIPGLIDFIKAVTGHPHPYQPNVSTSTFTERDLKKHLLRHYPPDPEIPPLPSYLEVVHQKPGDKISAQKLRECRELIRAKYALDVEAYSLRDVHYLNQHIVDDKKRRSKGALEDIKRTIEEWTAVKDQWSPEEWKQVEMICKRIQILLHPKSEKQVDPDIIEMEG